MPISDRDDGPDIQRMLYHGAVLVRVAESEDFGRSRIPNKTGSRIFCPTPDVQLDHFLHHTPKLKIPVEFVEFLLKLLLKQIFLAVHHDFH